MRAPPLELVAAMEFGAAMIAALIGFGATLVWLSRPLADQIRCRITLDFAPFAMVDVRVPMERQREFADHVRDYARTGAMLFGDASAPLQIADGDSDVITLQICNRLFNLHIDNIDSPGTFRIYAMRAAETDISHAEYMLARLLRILHEHNFALERVTPSGGLHFPFRPRQSTP